MKSKEWQLICYVKPGSESLGLTYCRIEDTNAFLDNIARLGVDLKEVVICRGNGIYFYTGDFNMPVKKYRKTNIGWSRWTIMNAVFLPCNEESAAERVIDFLSDTKMDTALSDYNYPMVVQSRDDAAVALNSMFDAYIQSRRSNDYAISLEAYTAKGRIDFLFIPENFADTYTPPEKYLESHSNIHKHILSSNQDFLDEVQWVLNVVGGVNDTE